MSRQPDTGQGSEQAQDRRHRRLIDPTITVGNILTVVALTVAGFSAWSNIDKRIALVEMRHQEQRETDVRQDRSAAETKSEIREELRQLNQKMDRLIESRSVRHQPSTGATP